MEKYFMFASDDIETLLFLVKYYKKKVDRL